MTTRIDKKGKARKSAPASKAAALGQGPAVLGFGACACCGTELKSDFYVLSGGALVRTGPSSATIAEKGTLVAFLTAHAHIGPAESHRHVDVFDCDGGGQWEIYTCSKACLLEFLRTRLDELP